MLKGDIYLDRRKHKRVQTKLRVTYKIMSGDELEESSLIAEKRYNVETDDISTSGLQLICDEAIEKEKIVRLDVVVVPGNENIATFAEVRWVRRDEALKKFRIGLEFLVVKEDHIGIIKKITGEQ